MNNSVNPPTYVILVDKHDNEIGIAEKLVAHQQGQLHRAFSVFVFRKKDQQYELLLQQRNLQKYHSPGLWTNTCCSHPRPGENVLSAAKKRLHEEMGIEVDLTEVGSFCYKAAVENNLLEHEYDHVLIGITDITEIKINQDEVADYRWISLTRLQQELTEKPKLYTAWFKQALDVALTTSMLNH